MNRTTKKPTRLRALLALALGAVAVLALAGIAVAKDGNGDKIPDQWEKRHDLSLQVDQSRRDQDHDGLRNRAEFRSGNDPRNRDSDDDGTMDGDEGAGTIASFDTATGKLVIALFGGDEISGLVTDRTKIKCEDEHSHDSSGVHPRRSHGESEPGDDHGGHGNEVGDDSGGGDGSTDDNSGPGSEHSGQSGHDDNGTGANCTTADLIVGSVVEEAELEIEHGKASFDEVELAH
ncbi:MAG TPA: hypothetical protein VHR18_08855 [Solirubrobacterales bacterium]|nr:hypothetical protein [Solirubrobacterales bacterium]